MESYVSLHLIIVHYRWYIWKCYSINKKQLSVILKAKINQNTIICIIIKASFLWQNISIAPYFYKKAFLRVDLLFWLQNIASNLNFSNQSSIWNYTCKLLWTMFQRKKPTATIASKEHICIFFRGNVWHPFCTVVVSKWQFFGVCRD